MPRYLLDTNVALDTILQRAPHYAYSSLVWRANVQGLFEGYLAGFTLPTLFYLCQREYRQVRGLPAAQAQQLARNDRRACLNDFKFCSLLDRHLRAVEAETGKDYEDNLQIVCAMAANLDAIVTRNPKDFAFASSRIQIFTPEQLLHQLGLL